jgi:hypothetical protein
LWAQAALNTAPQGRQENSQTVARVCTGQPTCTPQVLMVVCSWKATGFSTNSNSTQPGSHQKQEATAQGKGKGRRVAAHWARRTWGWDSPCCMPLNPSTPLPSKPEM